LQGVLLLIENGVLYKIGKLQPYDNNDFFGILIALQIWVSLGCVLGFQRKLKVVAAGEWVSGMVYELVSKA